MKVYNKLLLAITISTLTIINANAADITPNDIKQLAQNTQADSMHKYSADGKIKYEYQIKTGADGKPELVTKKSYLPAVTDGKIIDKTRSYKLALNAKKFGKYLGKGAGYATFAQMAIDILGAGVDYVLDPKNNSVQISRPNNDVNNVVWKVGLKTYNTAHDACIGFLQQNTHFAADKRYIGVRNVVSRFNNGVWTADCYYDYKGDESYFNVGGRVKSKPDVQVMTEEEFAKEVLKAAATQNNDKAKKVVIDYAKQEILDGDHDDVINDIVNDINSDTNTQPNPTDTTPSKDTDNNPNSNPQTNPKEKTDPKPKDEGGGFELPPFCSWATKLCDFVDWVKEPPPKPEDNKPIPKANLNDMQDLQELDRFKKRIDFEGQCPTGQLSFTVKSVSYSYSIPYTHFCSLLEQLRPWLLAFAYLSTAYFVVSNL